MTQFEKSELFSKKPPKKYTGFLGDITRNRWHFLNFMHLLMHRKNRGETAEIPKIALERLKFSTLSTGLSTGQACERGWRKDMHLG